jgi:hypothetical protein
VTDISPRLSHRVPVGNLISLFFGFDRSPLLSSPLLFIKYEMEILLSSYFHFEFRFRCLIS